MLCVSHAESMKRALLCVKHKAHELANGRGYNAAAVRARETILPPTPPPRSRQGARVLAAYIKFWLSSPLLD